GRPLSPLRFASRAVSWSPAAASPSRPSSRRSTRSRPATDREEPLMPGLLRGMARTAVVAGTATAVSNRVSRRQASRWAQQDDPYGGQQQAYEEPPPPPPPAAPEAPDPI